MELQQEPVLLRNIKVVVTVFLDGNYNFFWQDI